MSVQASPRERAARVGDHAINAKHIARASLLLVLVLTGCAAPRIKPDADLLARQDARERALDAQDKWQLEGRLGVSDGRDGGSGSLQ